MVIPLYFCVETVTNISMAIQNLVTAAILF